MDATRWSVTQRDGPPIGRVHVAVMRGYPVGSLHLLRRADQVGLGDLEEVGAVTAVRPVSKMRQAAAGTCLRATIT
jgi:hypothetical protein